VAAGTVDSRRDPAVSGEALGVGSDEQSTVRVTLASYEQGIDAYFAGSTPTPIPVYAEFRYSVAALFPADARMLEFGSGPAHDALFFEASGVRVQRTDGAAGFVGRLRSNGYDADLLDVTADEFGGPFDIVFANAVLLHLTADQFDEVLAKAGRAVHPQGLLAFTVKEGDGAAWTMAKLGRPRYFTYWRAPEMRERLSTAGWEPLNLHHVQGRFEPWLYLICWRAPQ